MQNYRIAGKYRRLFKRCAQKYIPGEESNAVENKDNGQWGGRSAAQSDTPLTGLSSSSHASFSRWVNHGIHSG